MHPLKEEQIYLRTQRKVHIYLLHIKGIEPFWTSVLPSFGNIIQDKIISINDWRALARKPYEVILNGC